MKHRYILRPDETTPLTNLLAWITSRDTSKEWEVTVKPYTANRSLEQNAYYWGVVLPAIQKFILEHRGENYSCDDIHEWYRDEFLPKRVVTIKGKEKIARPTTTKLNTAEFSEYLERVIHHAAENGIVIPEAA